jgi:outer membrane protein OmpA-like peptidoglycan-associated protein
MVTTRRASLGLLASLCAASPALALDWTPDATRILGDPGFLPTAGQVSGSFGYTYSANLYATQTTSFEIPVFFDSTKSYPSSFDRSANAFLPSVSYGITDDISVSAELGWGNARNHESYVQTLLLPTFPFRVVQKPATASFHALGADDPVFSATWRAIDQRYAPFSVDLTGSYSPDIFQARGASAEQTGTLATGGQAGSAQLAVLRETRFLTLRFYGGFAWEGRRNEVLADAEDLRSRAHASYTAGLQSEARLLPWLALNTGIAAQKAARYDRDDIGRFYSFSETIRPGGTISPYAGLLVPLAARHIVGELLYQHVFEDDETVTDCCSETRYTKQESNEFTARVLFAFGGAPAPLPPADPPTQPSPLAPDMAPARTYLVFFDWDRADLTTRARQIVAQAAQAATHATTTRIDVRGYTDLSGTATYNQALSLRRARSVQAELVRDGIARDEITIHGYGETSPLVPTAAGMREPQNRRVEIMFQ